MSDKLKAIHIHAFDFWLARSSVVVVIVFQALIINKLTVGPRWLAPGLELALLIPLSMATAWTQSQARDATTHHHWLRVARMRRLIRRLAVILTALVSVLNFGSLLLLVRALLSGHNGELGPNAAPRCAQYLGDEHDRLCPMVLERRSRRARCTWDQPSGGG